MFSSITIHKSKEKSNNLPHFRGNCFSNKDTFVMTDFRYTHKLNRSPNLVMKSPTRPNSKFTSREAQDFTSNPSNGLKCH